MSSGKATLNELQTVYGLKDMWDLIEIISVSAHNEYAVIEAEEQEAKRRK